MDLESKTWYLWFKLELKVWTWVRKLGSIGSICNHYLVFKDFSVNFQKVSFTFDLFMSKVFEISILYTFEKKKQMLTWSQSTACHCRKLTSVVWIWPVAKLSHPCYNKIQVPCIRFVTYFHYISTQSLYFNSITWNYSN